MRTLIAESAAVTIRRVAVSAMDNNVYLLTARSSGRQILIDAANDQARILAMMAEAARDGPAPGIDMIITTHSHHDHLGALAEMADLTAAVVVAGRDDAQAINTRTTVEVDRMVDDGESIGVAGIDLAVIGLRGHTPGSIALAYAEPGHPVHIFTGDSLFPGGLGNTGHDPYRFASLFDDVNKRIFDVYDDATIVHPGHGAPTTLGSERPHLGAWRARGW